MGSASNTSRKSPHSGKVVIGQFVWHERDEAPVAAAGKSADVLSFEDWRERLQRRGLVGRDPHRPGSLPGGYAF